MRDLMIINSLTKFAADWLIFVDARVSTKSDSAIFPNSRANNSGCSGSICPIIKFIGDLITLRPCINEHDLCITCTNIQSSMYF